MNVGSNYASLLSVAVARTADGRIKPEIVTSGCACNIHQCLINTYGDNCGTSMACPGSHRITGTDV